MKTNITLLGLFCILFIGLANATIEFTPNPLTLNASHNQDLTISFALNNTDLTNYTSINWAQSITPKGLWKQLPVSDTLNSGEVKPFQAILSVPQYISSPFSPSLTANLSNNTFSKIISIPITIQMISSPSLSLSKIQELTNTQNGTLNITNTGNTLLSSIILSASGIIPLAFSSNNLNLNPGSSIVVTAYPTANLDKLNLGENTITITASTITASATTSFSQLSKSFCDKGNINTSKLEIVSIKDVSSENDWEWKPQDDIKVDVKIRNEIGDNQDFTVTLGIYDVDTDSFVEINDDDTIEQEISIDDGKSDTVEFEFAIPNELTYNDQYLVYVKAYPTDEESKICNSNYQKLVKVVQETREVILNNFDVSQEAAPGDLIKVTARVYNIGKNDESKVKIILKNTKLGLNQEVVINNLDQSDSKKVEFEFQVPQNAQSGIYTLQFSTMFDYRKSDDIYKKTSEQVSQKTWESQLKIIGTDSETTPIVTISTSFDPNTAQAGKNLVVKAVISNVDTNTSTFSINVNGFLNWATLDSISDRSITLRSGESKEVTFNFNVDKAAKADNSFVVEVRSGDKLQAKTVPVNIKAIDSFGSNLFSGNGLIWVIGAINLILIILIVFVAVRLSRR